ncbi:hypothetical protein V6N13_072677 [Hibiscus sabdariffa]
MKSDGSSGGIGGILRDLHGKKFLQFSLSIGPVSVVLAKLMVVEKGLKLFIVSHWFKKHKLIIETYGKTVVEWVHDPTKTPACFSSLISGMVNRMFDGWLLLRHVPRSFNAEAHLLAEQGIR